MSKFDKYKRKVCPPIKDKRPRGMRSVPTIGYELTQRYARYIEAMEAVDTALKELREERDNGDR